MARMTAAETNNSGIAVRFDVASLIENARYSLDVIVVPMAQHKGTSPRQLGAKGQTLGSVAFPCPVSNRMSLNTPRCMNLASAHAMIFPSTTISAFRRYNAEEEDNSGTYFQRGVAGNRMNEPYVQVRSDGLNTAVEKAVRHRGIQ